MTDNAQVFRAERYFCEVFGSHTDSHCSFYVTYPSEFSWGKLKWKRAGGGRAKHVWIDLSECKVTRQNPLSLCKVTFFLLKHELRAVRWDSWGCQQVLHWTQHIIFVLRKNNNAKKPLQSCKIPILKSVLCREVSDPHTAISPTQHNVKTQMTLKYSHEVLKGKEFPRGSVLHL